MPAKTGTTFAVSAIAAHNSFTGFVDMLRYDAARVVESDSTLIILTADRPPTDGRWTSFGIPVLAYQNYGPRTFVDIPLLRDAARSKLPLTTLRAPRLPGVREG